MGFDLNPCYHLISTSAKPKMNGLKPGYLDMAIIGKTRKIMKGLTKIILKGASDNSKNCFQHLLTFNDYWPFSAGQYL